MTRLRREFRTWHAAVTYFTRVPLPSLVDFDPADLQRATAYLPAIGLLVGLVGGGVTWLAALLVPLSVAVFLGLGATVALTGALHEDGAADSCDGLGGGTTRERTLEIMRDSRLGTYGALGLFLLLGTKISTLQALGPWILPASVVGHTLSRAWILLIMRLLPYAQEHGKAKPLAQKPSRKSLLLGLLLGAMALPFLPPWATLAWLAAGIPALALAAFLRRRLQGYTGDTLGLTQGLVEVAWYLGLLVAVSVAP